MGRRPKLIKWLMIIDWKEWGVFNWRIWKTKWIIISLFGFNSSQLTKNKTSLMHLVQRREDTS